MTEALPKVTMIVFVYNQETTVENAALSALSQRYPNLEVILSDDGSADGSFGILKRVAEDYKGPHRVKVRRSSVNKGVSNHLNEVMREITGEYIVAAAGDDVSLPTRVSELAELWMNSGKGTVFMYSDADAVDDRGEVVEGWTGLYKGPHSIERMARGNISILGATGAFTRDVMDSFAPLPLDLLHEDRVLPFRALLLKGRVMYLDRKLVRYRIVGGVSRQKLKDVRHYVYEHLPFLSRRLLPDARLRLAELTHSPLDSPKLRMLCRRTILDLTAQSELPQARGIGRERLVAKYMFKGARIGSLLRIYAKIRLMPFINHKVEF